MVRLRKRFLPAALTQVFNCYSVDYKYIYIFLIFSKASGYGVFHIQLRGFDLINYIYIQTQTNLAG